MFTGIISHEGKLVSLVKKTMAELTVEIDTQKNVKVGDSIAVNGACLTVIGLKDSRFRFQLSPETLDRSHFSDLLPGSWLNIEFPLTLGDPLGGHLVSGHIDGTVRVKSVGPVQFSFVYPCQEWQKYIIPKGSVTLNGVSLTVSDLRGSSFSVSVIPHTLATTNFKYLQAGQRVNIELDLIGKYLYNFIESRK